MTLNEAQHVLRSGDGDIRPIIDWLATVEDAASLLPLLGDDEARASVLYVYSQLPTRRIPLSVFHAIEDLLPKLAGRERTWGQEIVAERGER